MLPPRTGVVELQLTSAWVLLSGARMRILGAALHRTACDAAPCSSHPRGLRPEACRLTPTYDYVDPASSFGSSSSLAPVLQESGRMRVICEHIKSHVSEVLVGWERLVREEPWYSLPADHRIDSPPDVIVGLVEASLCNPQDEAAHRQEINAAATHGSHRREQGIPEHMILTEYHLLRQALWRYLTWTFGPSDRTVEAITQIDTAITLASNGSMWGYYRQEVEAIGKWEEAIERIVTTSPLLLRRPPT